MSYTETDNLNLRKDDGNESIINWRAHSNSNLDLIDASVGNLVDAIANAKALLGQLGLDQNGDPLVNAATARGTLDAAQSENAAGSLYDAEQAIGVNAGNIATNASAIASLQDSVNERLKAEFGYIGVLTGWPVISYNLSNGTRRIVYFKDTGIELLKTDHGTNSWVWQFTAKPDSVTISIWGLPLISYTTTNGVMLAVRVPKPHWWTPTSVRASSTSATFDLIRIDTDTPSTMTGTTIAETEIARVCDTYIIVSIKVNKTVVDGSIYRVSWTVPDLTLS